MIQSSPSGTLNVRSRLTSFAVFAAILASLFTFPAPTLGNHLNASDFFIFSKAVFGKALDAEGGVQCDAAQDLTASVSGSNNEIFGRIHSNADWNGGGQNNLFYAAVTYGTHDEDCTSDPGDNDYAPPPPNNGSPTELDASPAGVGTAGWPGTLGDALNADGLTFGNDITQVLGAGATCAAGTSLTNTTDIVLNAVTDNNKVICNGTGTVSLNVQDVTMKVTIISHGLIEISGQNASLSPADAGHGVLAWTDQSSFTQEFSIKVAGSNFNIGPSILFSPRSGQDISGSEGDELCIQHIGQGQIKVQGSTSNFGPGACGPPPQNPDVSVVKSPDGGTINAGGTATFTMLVTNLGPGASNVTLSDTLPTAVTWAESADPSNACTVSAGPPQVLSCDFGSVSDAAGSNTRTVSVSAPTDSSDCGTLNNTVTITASGDVNLTNNTDTGSIIVACPNVSVSKSPDGENVTAGGTATFSITVTNNGPGAASNVTLSDTLPNGGMAWSEASDSHNACTVSALPAPQTLSCNFGTVSDQAGQNTRTVSVSSPVDTGDCGPKNNTVTISATGDINAVDNSDTGLITVLCPIIRVEKTPDEDVNDPSANDINAGDNATFTITVYNDGNGVANGVTVFDDLPGLGWSVVEGADTTLTGCAVTDPAAGEHAGKGEILTCGPDTLGVGLNKKVTVTRDTTVADCGELNNTAMAAATNNGNDSDPGNIDVLCPNLVVEKTPDGEVINAGEDIEFTIKVTNNGPGVATNVDIDDHLPAGFTWSEDPDLTECSIVTHLDHQDLHCDVGDLADDAFFEVSVSAATDKDDCSLTAYFNTARADADNHAEVTNTGDVLIQCPNLVVEKTPDGEVINAGEDIEFTIKVTNNGPGVATNVDIDDHLPAGFTWSEDPDLTECSIVTHLDHQDLHCDVGDLADDAFFEVSVSAATDKDDCSLTAYFNTARADADNHAEVTNTGDVLIQCPNLVVEKTPDGEVINAGEDIEFTIKVTNNGPGVATNVDIDDHLPAGFTWSEDPDLTECSIVTHLDHQDLHCDVGDLADDAFFEVSVSAATDKDDCSLTAYFNTARADADNHAEVTNTGDVLIQCPNLVVEKTPDGEVINAGEDIEFTIKVTNNGPGVATNVDIDDHLPAGFTWSEDPDLTECSIVTHLDHQDLHCDVGDLADDAFFEVSVSAATDKDDCSLTAYFNTARADADNHAEVTNTGDVLIQCPNLVVEKTPDGEVINAGEDIEFTIKVTNNGPGVATNVDIDDHLPAGFTWSEDPDLTECSIVTHLDHQDLHCDVGDLADDAFFEVSVSAATDKDDCSLTAYFNTARADADNHAEVTNTGDVLIQCPNLVVEKTPDGEVINAGEDIEFTIKVTNNGPGVATNVDIDDHLPAGFTWSEDPDLTECSIVTHLDHQDLHCDVGDLADDAFFEVSVSAATDKDDCSLTAYFNTARADADNHAEVTNTGDVLIQCPNLNVLKRADADPIYAGEEASFTITIWNAGDGDALGVTLHDDLPVGMAWDFEIINDPDAGDPLEAVDCDLASSIVVGSEESWSIDCDLNTVEPSDITDEIDDEIVIRVFADTDRNDCGVMTNTAEVDASNLQEQLEALGLEEPVNVLTSTDTITVFCPIIAIEKENDAVGSVLPGTEVTYTLTLTVDDETESVTDSVAEDVVVVDVMPVGLENPTDISDGGTFNPTTRTITWNLGDLAHGEYELTYQAVVADNVANGAALKNAAAATSTNSQCPDLETLGPECEDDSTVIVRVPTLVIDKVASVEVITISGPASAPIATPSVVTWTLSYTLANGPVTGAVITDVVPAGFVFLDAANGGTLVGGTTVTWNLGTLTTSGSVSFRTTVNVATISRTAPTVNTAVIDSNETAPDDGTDSVRVTVEPPPLGGTPTPRPSLPNTATASGIDGQALTVPVELLVALFIGSLGTLALANVRARRR